MWRLGGRSSHVARSSSPLGLGLGAFWTSLGLLSLSARSKYLYIIGGQQEQEQEQEQEKEQEQDFSRAPNFLTQTFIYECGGWDVWGLPPLEYPGLAKVTPPTVFQWLVLIQEPSGNNNPYYS